MSGSKTKKISAPKGTRDLYPEDVLRQHYITNAWRDAAIRCGFDEIAGPTFETAELYSVKSGEGILGELFQAFSGKSPKEVERVKETGQAEFALRPEFTPTLARMYAAKAKELPQPCKWFTAGPYFRAERPQRGRLREFLQWNVDFIGESGSEHGRVLADLECIFALVSAMYSLGLSANDVKVHIGSRGLIQGWALKAGIKKSELDNFYTWLDGKDKRTESQNDKFLDDLGLNKYQIVQFNKTAEEAIRAVKSGVKLHEAFDLDTSSINELLMLTVVCRAVGLHDPFDGSSDSSQHWCNPLDAGVVRGLAYYTGTVFEALADGERAVAGGGRYDNLIELFGGPPTPACGFGMGDVVLGNLLDDKGLMPTGPELMDAVARPQASVRPVAFVVPNGDEDNEALVHTLVASLRRGIECEQWKARDDRKPWDRDRYAIAPMHARVTYKSTRNLKKLRADAVNQHARFFVEIHADNKVELTDLDKREPITSDTHGSFSVDPGAEHYVGIAISECL